MDARDATPSRKRARRRLIAAFRRYGGLFALGTVFLVATQACALSVPQLLRIATDALVDADLDTVFRMAWGLVGLAALGAVTRVASRLLIFNSGRGVEHDLRQDAFVHLCRLAPSFFARMPLAQVMSRMVNDLTQVRLLLGPGVLNLTNTFLVYLVVIPLLLWTDWELTLLALLPLPILLLLGRTFARFIYTYSAEAQDRLGRLSTKVQENLTGTMTVRVYGEEAEEERRFRGLNEHYLETNLKLARLRGILFPLMGLAGSIGSVVVLAVGGYRIADGAMTMGQFVQFNAYLAALTWPTIALGWTISLWQRGVAAMDRLGDIYEAPPTLVDGPRPVEGPGGAFRGRVEVQHLSISYGRVQALDDVSLTIEPGQTVVLVGKTGAGKSTLMKVLARLVEVPDGTVFVDGADINQLPLRFVREGIGYAPQDAFLFSRSLRENVAFGWPDAAAEAVESAVQTAALDTDAAGFPEGLETMVGERGITLSGGQRQRTTLARALLVEPRVLLLDDTLSAVDSETEQKILEGLEKAKDQTVVIATHRLNVAGLADRIVVMEGGRVVEQGTESELLASGGAYATLHARDQRRRRARVA